MKIRTVIFLIVIVLGLFPLFVLVTLDLPKTIDRLEHAAEMETQARSQVEFTQLNGRIRCLKKNFCVCKAFYGFLCRNQETAKFSAVS